MHYSEHPTLYISLVVREEERCIIEDPWIEEYIFGYYF